MRESAAFEGFQRAEIGARANAQGNWLVTRQTNESPARVIDRPCNLNRRTHVEHDLGRAANGYPAQSVGYWISRAPPPVVTGVTETLRGLSFVTLSVALPCTQICPATRAMLGEFRFTTVFP